MIPYITILHNVVKHNLAIAKELDDARTALAHEEQMLRCSVGLEVDCLLAEDLILSRVEYSKV